MGFFSNPTSPTFSMAMEVKNFLLQGCNSLKHLKHVHGRLLRSGLDQDNYLINMILRFSFDHGNSPKYARLVFEQCKQPNIYLWNTMLRGLVSNDCFHDAIEIYTSMRKAGFLPDNFTFPFVLKGCARILDFKLGLRSHSLVVKLGFDYDVFVKTSLVCLYAKCGFLEDARQIFDDIPNKNVVSWTAIICGYIECGHFKEAIDLFRGLFEMGLKPDSFTLTRVLYACTQAGDLKSGEWIDKFVTECGMERNVFVTTSLVDMYAKCGRMEKARSVFDGMHEKDVVCWSTMIQGYASNGFPKEAINLFFQMQRENLKPDCYAMVGVLSACARLGALNLGHWVRGLINDNELPYNPVLGTALIDMYAKCGSMTQAWEVFKVMKEKDTVIFNAAISGLAMNGHVKPAFGLFGQMEKHGILPDETTFVGLLCGCTHSGLVRDGRQYFHSLSSIYSLTPAIEHYGCMVDLLGRAGMLIEAHNLINSMPMKANTIVWGALLGGCRLHRDNHLAELALKQLIELEPLNSAHYVLLSNVYSASQRWDEVEKIRSTMNEKGIQKVPGCSWTEVNGVIHEFLVGDKSHPLSQKIYEKLDELLKDLREVGYNPTTEFVLFDIEDEEKEHNLSYHSEKLAVAYALVSTNAKDVIRIVKNLRVCGDCHEAIKLISKLTGREIIVRDNNRFHYFMEGSCSCDDYW